MKKTICQELGGCIGSPSDDTYCPINGNTCLFKAVEVKKKKSKKKVK